MRRLTQMPFTEIKSGVRLIGIDNSLGTITRVVQTTETIVHIKWDSKSLYFHLAEHAVPLTECENVFVYEGSGALPDKQIIYLHVDGLHRERYTNVTDAMQGAEAYLRLGKEVILQSRERWLEKSDAYGEMLNHLYHMRNGDIPTSVANFDFLIKWIKGTL